MNVKEEDHRKVIPFTLTGMLLGLGSSLTIIANIHSEIPLLNISIFALGIVGFTELFTYIGKKRVLNDY